MSPSAMTYPSSSLPNTSTKRQHQQNININGNNSNTLTGSSYSGGFNNSNLLLHNNSAKLQQKKQKTTTNATTSALFTVQAQKPMFQSQDSQGSDTSYESSIQSEDDIKEIGRMDYFKEEMGRFFINYPQLINHDILGITTQNAETPENGNCNGNDISCGHSGIANFKGSLNKNDKSISAELGPTRLNQNWHLISDQVLNQAKQSCSFLQSLSKRIAMYRAKVQQQDIIDLLLRQQKTIMKEIDYEINQRKKQIKVLSASGTPSVGSGGYAVSANNPSSNSKLNAANANNVMMQNEQGHIGAVDNVYFSWRKRKEMENRLNLLEAAGRSNNRYKNLKQKQKQQKQLSQRHRHHFSLHNRNPRHQHQKQNESQSKNNKAQQPPLSWLRGRTDNNLHQQQQQNTVTSQQQQQQQQQPSHHIYNNKLNKKQAFQIQKNDDNNENCCNEARVVENEQSFFMTANQSVILQQSPYQQQKSNKNSNNNSINPYGANQSQSRRRKQNTTNTIVTVNSTVNASALSGNKENSGLQEGGQEQSHYEARSNYKSKSILTANATGDRRCASRNLSQQYSRRRDSSATTYNNHNSSKFKNNEMEINRNSTPKNYLHQPHQQSQQNLHPQWQQQNPSSNKNNHNNPNHNNFWKHLINFEPKTEAGRQLCELIRKTNNPNDQLGIKKTILTFLSRSKQMLHNEVIMKSTISQKIQKLYNDDSKQLLMFYPTKMNSVVVPASLPSASSNTGNSSNNNSKNELPNSSSVGGMGTVTTNTTPTAAKAKLQKKNSINKSGFQQQANNLQQHDGTGQIIGQSKLSPNKSCFEEGEKFLNILNEIVNGPLMDYWMEIQEKKI